MCNIEIYIRGYKDKETTPGLTMTSWIPFEASYPPLLGTQVRQLKSPVPSSHQPLMSFMSMVVVLDKP